MYAQVIVDIASENVNHAFTYAVPYNMDISPGQRVLVPFGRISKEGIVTALSESTDVSEDKIKPVTRIIEDFPVILPHMMTLASQIAVSSHCPLSQVLRLMLPAEMRGEKIKPKVRNFITLAISTDKLESILSMQGKSMKRRKIIQLLADGNPHPVDEIKCLVADPLPSIHQLEDAGIVKMISEEVMRTPSGFECNDIKKDYPLTSMQTEVVEEIIPQLHRGKGKFLLHGVTGSGKTEVFVHLVRETLKMGKKAIILVPEIALTPQMVDYFHSRFGNVAAVIHSRLSAGERYDEWRRILRGEAGVVVGARSAIFSPVSNLGLVVVDEEHETTYQNDRNPRYDARDVAAMRCDNEGASLILASATPSILSFARARRGDYMLLELTKRVNDRPLPSVEIVDMRQELEMGNRSVFSLALKRAIKQCVDSGNQAMLLMNHRGYNSFVSCRSCGKVIKCPNCDVALTYHVGGENTLRCHYCGHVESLPTVCPECSSRYIRYFGAGTQKVQEELEKEFPGVSVDRMDIDTTSGKDGHRKIIDRFRSGETKILVGTQMIAKGLDFPDVTLVGVIAADMSLNLPDYRARERTFQLLTQVAGRAGRGEKPGHVIIQTYKPEDETIIASASQDYRAFFESEFARRRRSLYPPFTAMARLLLEGNNDETVKATAEELFRKCQALTEHNPLWKRRVLMLHIDKPGVGMLRGKHRWHIMMKLMVHSETEGFIAAVSDMADQKYQNVSVYFEYNPTTMM